MITYFYTARYIYAVANGYCSAVLSDELEPLSDHGFVASRVDSAVEGNDFAAVIPLNEVAMRQDGTCRLRFQRGDVTLYSDLILRVETVTNMSVPPSYRDMQSTIPEAPDSIRVPAFRIPKLLGWNDD